MQYILVVAEAKATYLLDFDHLKYDLNLTQTYLLENICFICYGLLHSGWYSLSV